MKTKVVAQNKIQKNDGGGVNPIILGGILLIVLVTFFLLDILLGSVEIPLTDTLKILFGGGAENEIWQKIVLLIRLPKAFTAVLAGAALAVAGLQMQTLFRNPLAGPSVLGITSGASLGVAVVMLASGMTASIYNIQRLGIPQGWVMVIAAIAGSVLVMMIILAIASKISDNVILLIVGIMVGNITLAIVSVWQYYSNPQQIQDFLIWTFGSLGGVTTDHLTVLAISVLTGIMLTIITVKPLNGLLLGEGYASSMGVDIFQARVLIILATGILSGSVTAFCGPIGFVGIAVPHIARVWFQTSDHRVLIPAAALTGSILMLFCDMMASLPGSDQSLPINAVTALLGSPIVIWVILRQRNLKMSFS